VYSKHEWNGGGDPVTRIGFDGDLPVRQRGA